VLKLLSVPVACVTTTSSWMLAGWLASRVISDILCLAVIVVLCRLHV